MPKVGPKNPATGGVQHEKYAENCIDYEISPLPTSEARGNCKDNIENPNHRGPRALDAIFVETE